MKETSSIELAMTAIVILCYFVYSIEKILKRPRPIVRTLIIVTIIGIICMMLFIDITRNLIGFLLSALLSDALLVSILIVGFAINARKKNNVAVIINIVMILGYFISEIYISKLIANYKIEDFSLVSYILDIIYRIILITTILRSIYLLIKTKKIKWLILVGVLCTSMLLKYINENFVGGIAYLDPEEQRRYEINRCISYEIPNMLIIRPLVINSFVYAWFKDKRMIQNSINVSENDNKKIEA